MPAETLVILNPAARRGDDRFGRLEAMLKGLGDVEVTRTRGPADGVRLAREAARAGVRRLVVGGGDGTLSEAVTGVLEAAHGEEVAIGVLPLGSGCDFARSAGVPREPREAIALMAADIADGRTLVVDAGRITYRDRLGKTRTRYFLNEAGFGLSGTTVERVERAGKRFGPTIAFGLGSIGAIVRGGAPKTRIEVDDRVVHEGPVALVVCANGRCFGSGMRIAPDASLVDGELDVVIVDAMTRLRLLSRLPALYRGTHLAYDEARMVRGRRIRATPFGDVAAALDVDGEALGGLPTTIEVCPKAVRLFGLPQEPTAAWADR